MKFETGHIGINVTELERSRDFYRQIFGFELLGESHATGRNFAFLGTEGRPVLTLWQQSQGRFDAKQPGLHHLSFQVKDVAEVREAEEKLKRLNVRFHYDGIVPHREGAASGGIFFEDPDGVRLEIYAPSGLDNQKAPVSDAPSCGFF